MEKREELIAEIVSILNEIKDCEINDLDENLFGMKYDYSSGEMLDVCMELHKRYDANLNTFIGNIKDFTVNNMADALVKSC
jgi:hypothetical protein